MDRYTYRCKRAELAARRSCVCTRRNRRNKCLATLETPVNLSADDDHTLPARLSLYSRTVCAALRLTSYPTRTDLETTRQV